MMFQSGLSSSMPYSSDKPLPLLGFKQALHPVIHLAWIGFASQDLLDASFYQENGRLSLDSMVLDSRHERRGFMDFEYRTLCRKFPLTDTLCWRGRRSSSVVCSNRNYKLDRIAIRFADTITSVRLPQVSLYGDRSVIFSGIAKSFAIGGSKHDGFKTGGQ